jgi:hypothetical protein
MSASIGRVGRFGLYGGEKPAGAAEKSAAILHSVWWVLTSSSEPGERGGISPAGFTHTFAVCMLELDEMARGKGLAASGDKSPALPRFVDVKLTQDDKNDFLSKRESVESMVVSLSRLCDDGYRVGCSWSGEQQAYTVSLTCRDAKSVNAGLCMTSFARDLATAVALALYKHHVLTGENWLGDAGRGSEDFG